MVMKNIFDIESEITKLRKRKAITCAKISNYRKMGKDVSKFEAQLEDIRKKIADLTDKKKTDKVKETPVDGHTPRKKIVKTKITPISRPEKTWKKSELDSCKCTMNKMLEDNDWSKGYQFRSSEWMFIKDMGTKVNGNYVELNITIQYKTKNHRVERNIIKQFNPDNINVLQKFIDNVETWVMLNSGDLDDKQIVFGDRFNKVQFKEQKFAEKGWVIKK